VTNLKIDLRRSEANAATLGREKASINGMLTDAYAELAKVRGGLKEIAALASSLAEPGTGAQGETLRCSQCSFEAHTESGLAAHQAEHTGATGGSGDTAEEYPCTVPSCARTFPSLQGLRAHMRAHKDKKVPCPICNAGSFDAKGLRDHVDSHSRKWPCVFGCRPSSKVFYANKRTLHAHVKTKHSDKQGDLDKYEELRNAFLKSNPKLLPSKPSPEAIAEIQTDPE
jgi:hypothetical protein